MCTVSWLHKAKGHVLLCNRDERHTRKPALGPRISERNRPLTMAVLANDEPAMLIDWNGRELLVQADAERYMPLTSSSLQEPNAVGRRKEYFKHLLSQAGKLDAELLGQFHRSHVPVCGPYSVCMHREDAATVSFSAVTVTPEMIEFSYHGSSPCSERANTIVTCLRAS